MIPRLCKYDMEVPEEILKRRKDYIDRRIDRLRSTYGRPQMQPYGIQTLSRHVESRLTSRPAGPA